MKNSIPVTELPIKELAGFESLTVPQIIERIHQENALACEAVGRALPAIAKAIEEAFVQMKAGGRLVYAGAGTSGRLGVMDAAELPVTFGIPENRARAVLAGGPEAFFRAIEGAEDNEEAGRHAILQEQMEPRDLIIGISASGNTPFVIGAIYQAKEAGAKTIGLCCNPLGKILTLTDVPILLETGPEVLAGSTRMKAATAQKMALTMFSTTLMLKLGYAFGPYMVGVRTHNAKLKMRAVRILSEVAALTMANAEEVLKQAGWDLKVALVMAKKGVSYDSAKTILESTHGDLTEILKC